MCESEKSKIRLRIVSTNGLASGTKVIDVKTGKELEMVRLIEIKKIEPGEPIVATLEIITPEVDVVVQGDIRFRKL